MRESTLTVPEQPPDQVDVLPQKPTCVRVQIAETAKQIEAKKLSGGGKFGGKELGEIFRRKQGLGTPLQNDFAKHHLEDDHCWRTRLRIFIHGPGVHKAVLWLVILDLILISIGIIMEVEFLVSEIQDLKSHIKYNCVSGCTVPSKYGNYDLRHAEHYLAIASSIILCIMFVENLLICIAEEGNYFRDAKNMWPHYLDFTVIVVSLVQELTFISLGSDAHALDAGLLMTVRFWRLARVGEGVYEAQMHYEEGHCGGAELNVAERLSTKKRLSALWRGI